jgi:hypothetical protein
VLKDAQAIELTKLHGDDNARVDDRLEREDGE